ncbi:hypothetical protein Taro_035775 [Colocasia esculenta]|uniref:Uncharacterized protein n=1 Tax=Colocasia esculenta TaxID=4460 RepID=A0A843W4U0_COLES|nr:hypothetical protein [Colocasia esculenta]
MDTSRHHWSPASPVFPVPHFRELGPESLKVSGLGLQLCGLQLDLSSVTVRLRSGSYAVLSGLDTGVMNQSPFPCAVVILFRLVLCHQLWPRARSWGYRHQ